MNAPDRYEKFVVPDHLQKVEVKKDTKVADAATFVIQREDHTVGNLVRMIEKDDNPKLFPTHASAYRPLNRMFAMPDHERAAIKTGTQNTEDYPHVHGPQDRRMSCLLQLLEDKDIMFAGYKIPHPLQYQLLIKVQTNGTKTPLKAVQSSLQSLEDELSSIRDKFMADCERASLEESLQP